MAVPQAVAGGKAAQGGGEEPGGEGVTGADGRDDVDPEGPDEGGGAGGVLGPLGHLLVEHDGSASAVLDDQDVRFGQRLADRARSAQSPGVAGLVVADEDEVGAAREVEQDARPLGVVAPQPRAVVDVEGDEGAAGAGGGQLAHQAETAVGERGGDAGQVEHAARAGGGQVRVPCRHGRGGGPGPVVGDFVGVGRPVARGAEVDAGRPAGVPAHGGGVDAVRGDRLHQVVAEPVGADPADPADGVTGAGEHAGHVRLGAADAPLERRHVGEPSGAGGQEGDHGLAERHHVDAARADTDTGVGAGAGIRAGAGVGGRGVRGSVAAHGGRGSSLWRSTAVDGTVDRASAGMLDSRKRHTQ